MKPIKDNMNRPEREFSFRKGFKIGEYGEFEIWSEDPISYGVSNTFSEVYLALKTKTRKRYAIKILRPSIIMKYDRAILDFQDEIKFLMELEHKNIIKIDDYGTVKDTKGLKSVYLATEYIENANIIEKTYSYRINLRYAIQTCEGLRYLHRKGIVHRDIKPDNLLLYSGNTVKITDFGIAKFITQLDEKSSVVGPPAYAAPEQLFQTSAVDRRADIYSLGKTLFSLVTKEVPKPAKTIDTIPEKYKNKPWVPDFLKVVKKSTEIDPENRYQHIDDFRDDLVKLYKKARRKTYRTGGINLDTVIKRSSNFIYILLVLTLGVFLSLSIYDSYRQTIKEESLSVDKDRYLALAEDYFTEALDLYNSGPDKFEAAKKLFEESISYNPEKSECYRYLAIIYTNLKDFDKAETSWKEYIKVNTSDETAYINLAQLFISQKRIDEAIGTLEVLRQIHPGNKEAANLLKLLK